MARPAVAIALPADELAAVVSELTDAGFDAMPVDSAAELETLLHERHDVAVAILDAEIDVDGTLALHAMLHEGDRRIPALMVVSPASLDRVVAAAGPGTTTDDEYFTRPYSADSLRWRVEAMCIRSRTVDDGSGPIIQTGIFDTDGWARQATILALFSPKGGVGKTTIATNLAVTLQMRHGQRVMLIDADTVTGHVSTSLGFDQVRTVADSWRDELDGAPPETFTDIAEAHPSGLRVVSLTASPLTAELLDPARVAEAILATRAGFDFIIVDLHPSYSKLNRAIFDGADRILVPLTPDVPAVRATVQLGEVATELGIRARLAMIVNRANSGVAVGDIERTVGMPALALIRSGGLLVVRAANEGRTVIEMFPRERISEDFDILADRLLGRADTVVAPSRSGFRFFGRQKEAARA